MIGGGGVGKSAISIQFVQQHFVEYYDPTIEDSYRKQVAVDEDVALIEVLDTAGQQEYSAMREQWIRFGEGFFIVYSISSRHSFDKELPQLITQLERVRDSPVTGLSLILFGNKSDLSDQREVGREQGEDMAKKLGGGFFEGSAKDYINLDQAYFELVRIIRKKRKDQPGEQNNTLPFTRQTPRRWGGCLIL